MSLIYFYFKNMLLFAKKFGLDSALQLQNIMASTGTDLCLKLYLIICLIIVHYISIYIFIKSIAYSLYFIYYRLTLILRENPSLYHSPYFAQIDDYTYYNQYFAVEKYLLFFMVGGIASAICIAYIHYKTKDAIKGDGSALTYFSSQMAYLSLVFFLSIVFIIAFRTSILRTSSVINTMMDSIYDNLNVEYLQSVCEYTENKSESVDFIYGMCNGLQSNKKKLWQYVASVAIEWDAKYPEYNIIINENKNDLDYAKELLLKQVDDDGVSYYNKILRAMLTFSLINYFIDNNLRYEAQRFFSLRNIVRGFFGKFRDRENPFLYLKTNNLMLINYVFSFDPKSGIDRKIYDLLSNDYDDIKDTITNGIITAHDILNYKMTPSAYFHIMIAISGILIIIGKFIAFLGTAK